MQSLGSFLLELWRNNLLFAFLKQDLGVLQLYMLLEWSLRTIIPLALMDRTLKFLLYLLGSSSRSSTSTLFLWQLDPLQRFGLLFRLLISEVSVVLSIFYFVQFCKDLIDLCLNLAFFAGQLEGNMEDSSILLIKFELVRVHLRQ